MIANELRIGNLLVLSDTGESFTVTGMMLDSHGPKIYGQTYSGEYCSPRDNQCKPVILTEDWLLRAGFRRSGRYYKNHNWGYRYSIGYSKKTDRWDVSIMDAGIFSSIKYVHQLQNLYFSLTGHELTFANNHNPCTSPDPDDCCENCNCWKSTRSNCS